MEWRRGSGGRKGYRGRERTEGFGTNILKMWYFSPKPGHGNSLKNTNSITESKQQLTSCIIIMIWPSVCINQSLGKDSWDASVTKSLPKTS